MECTQRVLLFVALCAIISLTYGQVSQNGPGLNQEGQSRGKRQAETEDNADGIPPSNMVYWTTCNHTQPKISCADCYTRLICKPIGGLLKQCMNPLKPYCNDGICSLIPSEECAST